LAVPRGALPKTPRHRRKNSPKAILASIRRRSVMITLTGGVRRANPSTALRMGRGLNGHAPNLLKLSMFNFSANNLLLLSRTDCKSCVVFVMKDLHTKRLYRLYDFTKAQIITLDQLWCVSGKVNSADKLYLVIETVKTDTKNRI
jgi:hypothetical protein